MGWRRFRELRWTYLAVWLLCIAVPSFAASKDALDMDMRLGISQGYDNNVNLTSPRKDDAYLEESLDIRLQYPVIKGHDVLKCELELINTTYYEITDADMLDTVVGLGMEHRLLENVAIQPRYLFEFVWFPNDEEGDYVGNGVDVGVRHDVTDWFYHRASYCLLMRNFIIRKARLGNGNESADLRSDLRHTFNHEVGAYVLDIARLKLINQFSLNDSNDQYMDYYNYYTYKLGISITYKLIERLYNISAFYWIKKRYFGRLTSDDGETQKDYLCIFSTSLLYDLTDSISIYTSYSHTENYTNEPLDAYSGNIFSWGIFYWF